jgi:16S rRNA (cytosine967-C5)-methyltransferase
VVEAAVIPATGIQSRRAALRILGEVRDGSPFDVALGRSVGKLPEPDRRLAHELAAGVLRQRSVLDDRLAPLIPRGWGGVDPELQDILRLGAYQLTALERVPAHAAVDTSVALAKTRRGAQAAGFVNAVLRRLVRSDPTAAVARKDEADQLAVEYSHPAWLVRRWLQAFGHEGAENLLRWNNTRPKLVLQAAREDLDALAARWHEAGIGTELATYGAGIVTDVSRPADLPGYAGGSFIVQDPAHALLARYADLPESALVYDACAAPGGKTIAWGRRARQVVAGEVSPIRARRLAENLRRAGSGREFVVVADGRDPPLRQADVVVLDAPCLGTGTFSRNPDARWRVSPEALALLEELQAELLERAAAAVAPGGLLLYSTCSLEPEENQIQVDRFLAGNPDFRREPGSTVPDDLISTVGDVMILPHRHGMDGAYAARLRRIQ